MVRAGGRGLKRGNRIGRPEAGRANPGGGSELAHTLCPPGCGALLRPSPGAPGLAFLTFLSVVRRGPESQQLGGLVGAGFGEVSRKCLASGPEARRPPGAKGGMGDRSRSGQRQRRDLSPEIVRSGRVPDSVAFAAQGVRGPGSATCGLGGTLEASRQL